VINGNVIEKYYSAEVAENVPGMLRWIAVIYFGLHVLAAATVPGIKPCTLHEKSSTKAGPHPVSLKEVFSERTVYVLLPITAFAASWGIYQINMYKIFGAEHIDDDQFLSMIGSVGAVCNGLSRFLWAYTMEHYGFKTMILVLITIQAIICSTIYYIVSSKALYMLWISISMACSGGVAVMASSECGQLFGHMMGGRIASICILTYGVSAIVFSFI
jgi:MFS family permease